MLGKTMLVEHSDYIIYVDESGDHSLKASNRQYPIFVLAFSVFHKPEYINKVTPALQQFKFKHFGHDMVILHEHEIRKAKNDFKFLINAEKRKVFMSDLNVLISSAPFTLFAVGVDKRRLSSSKESPNPYHLALHDGLEMICEFLTQQGQVEKLTHVIVESRGKKEDIDLELEFRRISDEFLWDKTAPFDLKFVDKRVNSCGLQIADLAARPLGRNLLNPEQNNRAYEILVEKLNDGQKGFKRIS